MKGILLASHGKLAEGMLDTVKMFSGEPEQMATLCLMPGADMNEFLEEMKKEINRIDTGEGVIIFCDLLFGTPCNCSAKLLMDQQFSQTTQVITGMNLSMVLEYIGTRDSEMNSESLIKIGQDGIVDFNQFYKERFQQSK